MKRRHRLTRRTELEQVLRRGRSWSHPLLMIVALGNNLPYCRFGFLVGKRVGDAVVRNRIKRRMREAVHARLAEVSPGWDVVLIARAAVAQADFWTLKAALDSLLHRAGLIAQLPEVSEATK